MSASLFHVRMEMLFAAKNGIEYSSLMNLLQYAERVLNERDMTGCS